MTEQFEKLRQASLCRDDEYPGADEITPAFRGVELAGEVGEACNVIKKLERERLGIHGRRATVHQLAKELADVVICVDLIAMDYDIDLWSAVVEVFNDKSTELGLKTKLEKIN